MLSGQDVGSVPLWLLGPYRSDSGSQNFLSAVNCRARVTHLPPCFHVIPPSHRAGSACLGVHGI